MTATTSYTESQGKRPSVEAGYEPSWYLAGTEGVEYLPKAVFDRLEGGMRDDYDDFAVRYYPTEAAALEAADAAYLRAAADGAMPSRPGSSPTPP